jgi:hypothetical protein
LNEVSEALDLNPDFLLRYLDQNTHLTYALRSLKLQSEGIAHNIWSRTEPTELRIAVDQANHLSAVIIPGEKSGISQSSYNTDTWTGNCYAMSLTAY